MYICIVKLEEVLQTNKFKNERHRVGLNILYTAWWLKTKVNAELKKFGLTHEQYNVIRILKGKHPEKMCVKDIAGRMIEKNSNVPRIVDRLELKKFIQRNQSDVDGRQTMIGLTPTGLSVLTESTKKIEAMHTGMKQLTEEQASQLNALLEKIREE